MAITQSGKLRSSLRKVPPATSPKTAKVAASKVRKTIARKPAAPAIGAAQWQHLVATAAYFRAQARGFVGGSPEQDWLDAEAELMARLAPAHIE